MLKRIMQLAGLLLGVIIGWRLGIIMMEQMAPRRITLPAAATPVPAAAPASPPPPHAHETGAPFATASRNGHESEDEQLVYCLSCRERRPVVNAHEERTENGRLLLKGECGVCGRNVSRFIREAS